MIDMNKCNVAETILNGFTTLGLIIISPIILPIYILGLPMTYIKYKIQKNILKDKESFDVSKKNIVV